jgi:CrcB protein
MNLVLVALGGALGASMRYGLGRALPAGAWPWGTLAANVLGGFAMGLLAALALGLAAGRAA